MRKVVAVIILNPQGNFVILKRSSYKSKHRGLWNLPSGGIKSEETIKQAAIREAHEETGLNISNIKIGPSLKQKTPEINLDIQFIMAKTKIVNVDLNNESTEYKWVSPLESLNYKFAIPRAEVENILKSFKLL